MRRGYESNLLLLKERGFATGIYDLQQRQTPIREQMVKGATQRKTGLVSIIWSIAGAGWTLRTRCMICEREAAAGI